MSIELPSCVDCFLPQTDKLAVQGTGITPRPVTPSSSGNDLLLPTGVEPGPTSSRVSSTSEDDISHSIEDEEANSMLQGVVNMNQVGPTKYFQGLSISVRWDE